MAIYHLSGQVISRSQGRSAIACASYRSAEKLYDERTYLTHDFTKKEHDILYKEVMLPVGAPERLKNREVLWNEVEQCEKRKDAQLAREFNLALPKELSHKQNIDLAREFVQKEFVNRGMIADLCLHKGHKGTEEQPHIHVMLTMRDVTADGFGPKNRDWNNKELLELWRESWANFVNKELAVNGYDFRVDHRSNAERGIDLEPQYKIGTKVAAHKMVRFEDHQRIAFENGVKIFAHPDIALDAITKQQSTFTHQDLARFINRHTVDVEQFQRVYDKVKGCEQIVYLGKDEQGRERFSTKEMLALEKKMLANAETLSKFRPNDHAVKESFVDIPKHFSEEQSDALRYVLSGGDIKCIIGYAGSGKSTILNSAREAWEREGYRVHGVTLSGIAAENLTGASGISSHTVASRLYYWDRGEEKLTSNDILVVDEAGMLGSRQMARILEEAQAGNAKIVLIGDPKQLQAIEAGAAFRAITEETSYVELTQVRRQREKWQQEATKEFARGDVAKALKRYDQHDHLHEFDTQAEAKQILVTMWNDVRINNPDKTQIILAYTRKDSQELNERARDLRHANNELGIDHLIHTARGERQFAENDRIYFLKNDRSLGVMNGTLGTIEKIDQNRITVRLDKDLENSSSRAIIIDIHKYNHLDHGYAATIYKAQGVTVDRSFVLASKYMDNHSSYVAFTRQRESVDLFWGKDEFIDHASLYRVLGMDRSKDVTLDYGITCETELAESTENQAVSLSQSPEKQHAELESKLHEVFSFLIDKQIEFQNLVRLKNNNLVANPQVAKQYADQAVLVSKEMHIFAKQNLTNSQVKVHLQQLEETFRRNGVFTLEKCGGITAIKGRIEHNQLTDGDKIVLYQQMRSAIHQSQRELSLEQDIEISR